MKPEQFIREFGEKKAREVVSGAPRNAVYYWQIPRCKHGVYSSLEQNQGRAIVLEELKRLVESVELVEVCGGLVEAKKKMNSESLRSATIEYVLYKAIRDHESIYGGGDE